MQYKKRVRYPDAKTDCLDMFENMYVEYNGLYNEIIEGAVTEEDKILALINNSPNSIVVDMLYSTLLSLTPLEIVSNRECPTIRKKCFNFFSNYMDEMDLAVDATECYLSQMKYYIYSYFDNPQTEKVPPTKNS